MIDWQEIAEALGYVNDKQMFLDKYAQNIEQRKNGKLSLKGLDKLLGVSMPTISDRLKKLGIPIAPVICGKELIYWKGIAENFGYKSDKQMFLDKYAQNSEQRKKGKLSSRILGELLGVSGTSVLNRLKELGILRAGIGGANFKNTVIDPSKFGFETEEQLLSHWRKEENKSIREMYNAVLKHFGKITWHEFRMKLRKLGIVKKDIHANQDYRR